MPIIKTEDQIFDVRLAERHIDKGRTTKKEYQKYLKELENVEENAEFITADLIFEELRKDNDEEASVEEEIEEEEEEEEANPPTRGNMEKPR